MENQMSIRFNRMIDSWNLVRKAEEDYRLGLIDYGELIDHDYYSHECEQDLIHAIEIKIMKEDEDWFDF